LGSGQSLVEFALVMPIMLVVLLTVADFGRLFASALTVESAARTAAEVAANEYQREMLALAPTPLSDADYARIHQSAWQSICNEAGGLPGVTTASGSQCSGLPTVVCVHDGADTHCGDSYNDSAGIPSGCPTLDPGGRPSNTQSGGSETSKYVEVRICYRFNTLFNPVIPFVGGSLTPLGGYFDLERTRTFTVVDY
jgi:hypothetical protein